MAFKFFVVPIRNSEVAESELNGFLRKHTVLSLDRRWVDQGSNSFWSFCIDYLDPTGRDGKGGGAGRQASRVDYREVLPERDFALFTRLRDLRKEIAQAEGVPVYTVFNNDQLAQIVQKRARSKADLEAIVGVGEARIEKYGARFLEFLKQHRSDGDETSGDAV